MNQISVMSFDLDDTLWPIAPVMLAAEAQMWEWLNAQHPEVMKRRLDLAEQCRADLAGIFHQLVAQDGFDRGRDRDRGERIAPVTRR